MKLMDIQKTEMKKRRVLISSREPIVCYGLTHLINNQPDMVVCGETQKSSEILGMVETESPDLVILGLVWNTKSPFSLLQELIQKFPSLRILVISRHNSLVYAHRILRAGAGGFVGKKDPLSEILVAVRSLLDQENRIQRKRKKLPLEAFSNQTIKGYGAFINQLSNRELEVFHLLGKGFTARQVADALHISVKTVDTHRDSLKRKLGATSISQLIQKAVEWTLFQAAS